MYPGAPPHYSFLAAGLNRMKEAETSAGFLKDKFHDKVAITKHND